MAPPKPVTARKGTDGETYVYSRTEDRSPWFKAVYFWEKYKLIPIGLIGYLLASGFDYKTPKQHNAEIRAKVDTLETKIEAGDKHRTEIEEKLDILIKLRCLEMLASGQSRDLQLIELDCQAYIRWQPTTGPQTRPRG